MCGIAGIVSLDARRPISADEVAAMRDVIAHRGPDDAGLHAAPDALLASRRLAILDLSESGHMPMQTPDGRYTIVYNGEVYNFRELRAALEQKGRSFRSGTDTEVLLHLYAVEGAAMLDRLNGMFAFAVWDAVEHRLFCARDRLGVKPFYYAVHDGALYFASEAKALFRAGVPAAFDPATWGELVCFRYAAGETTPFKGVRRLLPGHVLTVESGAVHTARWWGLAGCAAARSDVTAATAIARFRETFDDAVLLRNISDVPVGVLLSGGLDSGTIAASLASQVGAGVSAFTVGFDAGEFDESPLARLVSQRWGLDHHGLTVSAHELSGLLEEASWFNDEPLVHGNEPHILAISRYAKSRVTVLLSGEGADETLGGYVRYRPLANPGVLAAARPFARAAAGRLRLRGRAGKLVRLLGQSSPSAPVLFNACDVFPTELFEVAPEAHLDLSFRETVLAEARRVYPGEPFRQAMFLDQHTFLCSLLDRNDRMTMAASIECRVPFLDYRLVESLASLPSSFFLGREHKPLLRRALGDRLPEAVLRHRKWGFGVPWNDYLRAAGPLRERVESLPDLEPIASGPFDRRRLRALLRDYLAGRGEHALLVRQLLFVAIWHGAHFGRLGAGGHALGPRLDAAPVHPALS